MAGDGHDEGNKLNEATPSTHQVRTFGGSVYASHPFLTVEDEKPIDAVARGIHNRTEAAMKPARNPADE